MAQLVSAGSKKENAPLFIEKSIHTFVLIAAPFSPSPNQPIHTHNLYVCFPNAVARLE